MVAKDHLFPFLPVTTKLTTHLILRRGYIMGLVDVTGYK